MQKRANPRLSSPQRSSSSDATGVTELMLDLSRVVLTQDRYSEVAVISKHCDQSLEKKTRREPSHNARSVFNLGQCSVSERLG